MQSISCRGPQQIEDDNLVSFHDDLVKLSRQLDGSGRLLYTGRQMTLIHETLKRVEGLILSGGKLDAHAPAAFFLALR